MVRSDHQQYLRKKQVVNRACQNTDFVEFGGQVVHRSDAGAERGSTIASLIETTKLNGVEPMAYLTDVITKIVNGHPNR